MPHRKGNTQSDLSFREFYKNGLKKYTKTCWVLKCDIKKFFASIDHEQLKKVLESHIADTDIRWLLGQIIDSFNTDKRKGVGLPLGNLTSQLLVNVYMNEFDRYIKHKIKAKYYIRYADDFVFVSNDRRELEAIIPQVVVFLGSLKLSLHEKKLFIKTLASGVDFLGWVHFPHHRVLRTATKKRMIKRTLDNPTLETLASYKGMLKHGNTYKLHKKFP